MDLNKCRCSINEGLKRRKRKWSLSWRTQGLTGDECVFHLDPTKITNSRFSFGPFYRCRNSPQRFSHLLQVPQEVMSRLEIHTEAGVLPTAADVQLTVSTVV